MSLPQIAAHKPSFIVRCFDVVRSSVWPIRAQFGRGVIAIGLPTRLLQYRGAAWWTLRGSTRKTGRALASGVSAAVSVGLGFLSLPVLASVLRSHSAGFATAVVGGPAVLLALLVARWALSKAPPAEWAQIVLSGQRASDVLRTLSYEMMIVARRFANEPSCGVFAREAETINKDVNSGPLVVRESLRERLRTLRAAHHSLNAYMTGQRRRLQRITEMKTIAAKELNIPLRNLSTTLRHRVD